MKISAKIIYAPSMFLYFSGIIVHEMLPHLSIMDMHRLGYMAMYFIIAALAILPGGLIVFFAERRKVEFSVGLLLRIAVGICAFLISYKVFWNGWADFYISMLVSAYVSLFCIILLRKDCRKQQAILRDKNTGDLYRISAGRAYRLSLDEAKKIHVNSIPVFEFSPGSVSSFNNDTSMLPVGPVSDGFSINDHHTGIVINPSSGMPMIGGISGIDVHGNSWGTNFNEPSSTYDPNKGY